MFKSKKKWVIWLQVVTITAAIFAVLFASFAMSPEIDNRITILQTTITLAADSGFGDDMPMQSVADTKGHISHTCLLVIKPDNDLALVGLVSSPETPLTEQYKASGAGFIFFRPPRIFSQA